MTNDYERYNFWHKELDQFVEEEKGKKMPIIPIEEDVDPIDTCSINRFDNDIFNIKINESK